MFWFGPLGLSLLVNIVLYIWIMKIVKKLSLKSYKDSITKRIIAYLIVFFLCWIWDFVGHLLSTLKCYFYPFFVLECLFSPLQGFMNCLVYGASKSRNPNTTTLLDDYSSTDLDQSNFSGDSLKNKDMIIINYGSSKEDFNK